MARKTWITRSIRSQQGHGSQKYVDQKEDKDHREHVGLGDGVGHSEHP